jgi:hypothetical protein
MATVRVRSKSTPETESQASAPAECRAITVTTTSGRQIAVRKLTALDRMRLALAVGAEAAENGAFMLYANLGASVTAIDGEPFAVNTRREIDLVVQVLDEEGMAAVLGGWRDAGWISAAEPGQASADHVEAVKN